MDDNSKTLKNELFYEDGNKWYFFENMKSKTYFKSGDLKKAEEYVYYKQYLLCIFSTEYYKNGNIKVVEKYSELSTDPGNRIK
jgi:hypothetical protein